MSAFSAVDPTPSAGPRRPVILVVDDSRFVRVTLVRGLSGAYTVQQAESGERAWELLLLDASIEAVLSDLSMPGVDGFELLRRVRESMLPRLRGLPFAVLSGADDPAQRGRAVELGADRFVVKGAGFEALFAWLADRFTAAPADAVPALQAAPILSDLAPPGDVSMVIVPTQVQIVPTRIVPSVLVPPAVAPTVPAPPEAAPSETLQPETLQPETLQLETLQLETSPLETAPLETAPPETAPTETAPTESAAAAQAEQPADAVNAAPEPAIPALAIPAPATPALVSDPLLRWYQAAPGRPAPSADAPAVLVRLHAAGLLDLPARLRRGVRSADALHVDDCDTAWLCVNASAALSVRLALRFGLLAAGRQAHATGARVEVSIQVVDPARPDDALAMLRASAPRRADLAGLSLRYGAGPGETAWECQLPWAAARLLIS
jgi:CheY-like chemotaxis protein